MERLAFMFKDPSCQAAISFAVKNSMTSEMLKILVLEENLDQKDDTKYIVYVLFSAETTNGLNKINQTIFKEFLIDCDEFAINCIDKNFHLFLHVYRKNSVFPPCSWGLRTTWKTLFSRWIQLRSDCFGL